MILLVPTAVSGNQEGILGQKQVANEDINQYYVASFSGNSWTEWKSEIENSNAVITEYLPGKKLLLKMNSSVKEDVALIPATKEIKIYRSKHISGKASNQEKVYGIQSIPTESEYRVLLFDASDVDQVITEISSIGGTLVRSSGKILRIRIADDKITDIGEISGVRWTEQYQPYTLFNDVATTIIKADVMHDNYSLNGTGQIVAVCDTGLDTGVNDSSMHADFRGRIVSIINFSGSYASDYHGHGTHVAGSVLGNGSLSGGEYKGIAPEAKLVFQSVGPTGTLDGIPDNLAELFQPAYNLGARIHTNSWGSIYGDGNYTTNSYSVDEFMWNNPDMLIIFSAGNEGVDSNGDGIVDEESISSPATAKNCITVGASENNRPEIASGYNSDIFPKSPILGDYVADNIEGIAAFSSRGPTNDGRVKPDIVAPGTFIISTRSSLGSSSGWGNTSDDSPYYLYNGGTSMSAPIVAGSAALVRQYYEEVENNSSPDAALIKATLINGAHDMTPGQYDTGPTQEIQAAPDYAQGWGRVDLEKSLFPQYPHVNKYFEKISLNDSQSWNITYNIVNEEENIAATLVWTDYPGTQLVNDLDLTLLKNNVTYYGNGGEQADTVNNVEQIKLGNTSQGNYSFSIDASNISTGNQSFALVMYFTCKINELPQNNSYTENDTTSVSMDLVHPDGVNLSSVSMIINGNPASFTSSAQDYGYTIQNDSSSTYSDGMHNVSVNALTNSGKDIMYNWTFYVSTQNPVIAINYPGQDQVIQNNSFDLNVSVDKLSDIWYNINGTTNSSPIRSLSLNENITLDDGSYNLTVFARDITDHLNSTSVNFTVFTETPVIDSPVSGSVYYIPQNKISINGSAGIADSVYVYVNGVLTNASAPVSNGVFNVSGVPISNGTNTINVSASFNNSLEDFFTLNSSVSISLGQTISTNETMQLSVPGWKSNASSPYLDFNVSGEIANMPQNLSVALITGNESDDGVLAGPVVDIKVLNESDPDYSHQFGRNVSLELGYELALVNDTSKLVVAWYDPEEEEWVSFRSDVNNSEETVSANITHLSIYAPLEDNTASLISSLTGTGGTSSTSLSWQSSPDTEHVEIWRSGTWIANSTSSSFTNSGLSSGTSYSYSLRAIDYVDNIGNWSNITISTTSQSTTSTSGGGGGGGGGGSTGEEYENIDFKDVLNVYAGKNSLTEFIFDDERNDVTYIKYTSLRNSGKISTTIEILKNTSALADTAPPGIVYRNLNIWVGKTGYATETNIKDPTIGFRVGKEWMNEMNIEPSSIKLNRYSEGNWSSLATENNGDDEEYLYFEAETPGFSPFAITGTSMITSADNEKIPDKDDNPYELKDDKSSADYEEKQNEDTKNIPAINPLFTFAVLTIAAYFKRQQN